jgi:anti-sigma factor RsiW
MSKCRDIELLLTAYVDGEAAPTERAAVEAHLDRCPPCRDRVVGERVVRTVLVARRDSLRVCASERLHARCAATRRQASDGAGWRVLSRRTWVPLSLAATLVLAVAGVFLLGLNDNVEALAAQLALDHVKCFQVGVDQVSLDAASAGRTWRDTHGWTLEVPGSAPAVQLVLCDVRRCLTTDGRVAHLMYKWRGQPLSVFVLPHTIGAAGDVETIVAKFGQDAVIWSQRGRTYVVVAKAKRADLAPVLVYVKENAR